MALTGDMSTAGLPVVYAMVETPTSRDVHRGSASVTGTGRAARMMARDPWLAGYDVRTAVVLGDAARLGEMGSSMT